jgi:hypothetical protein
MSAFGAWGEHPYTTELMPITVRMPAERHWRWHWHFLDARQGPHPLGGRELA